MVMELYACGFNAWNQLRFDGNPAEEPYDLWEFEKVFENERIEIRRAGVSSTLVDTSSGPMLAGVPEELITRLRDGATHFIDFAEADNGKVVAIHNQNGDTLREYKSWADYPHRPDGEWEIGKIVQVVAGRTAFAALTAAGEVWTWGDQRYSTCLGRDISSSNAGSSASQPGLVTDLQSLPGGPIAKISSGAYIAAALTVGHDLYLWGADEFLSLVGQPIPADLGDMDVGDMGVGDGHVIVSTCDGKVLVIGKGENGQLGMGEGIEELAEWKEVNLKLEPGSKIVQVVAGPKCSMVLVATQS